MKTGETRKSSRASHRGSMVAKTQATTKRKSVAVKHQNDASHDVGTSGSTSSGFEEECLDWDDENYCAKLEDQVKYTWAIMLNGSEINSLS